MVYSIQIMVEETEFAESKNSSASGNSGNTGNNGASGAGNQNHSPAPASGGSGYYADGFMNIPDGIDEELPFN